MDKIMLQEKMECKRMEVRSSVRFIDLTKDLTKMSMVKMSVFSFFSVVPYSFVLMVSIPEISRVICTSFFWYHESLLSTIQRLILKYVNYLIRNGQNYDTRENGGQKNGRYISYPIHRPNKKNIHFKNIAKSKYVLLKLEDR